MSQKSEQSVDGRASLLPKKHEEEDFKAASFHGSVFNLSCSIVGAGIMSLAAVLRVLGLIPGVALIIFSSFMAESSVEILLRFSKPGFSFSYGEVMEDAFGMIGKLVLQTSVVLNNTIIVIVYLIIIEDVLSGSTSMGVHHAGILEGWFGEHWWTGRAFVLIFLTLLVFIPLICFKRIDSLRYTSAISLALSVVSLVVITGITIYKLIKGSIETPKWFPLVTDLASFWNLFTAVPIFVSAYLCHFNVHTIESELEQSSGMQSIVRSSIALCTIVYVMTGSFGFLLFGDSTMSDLLSNFDTDLGIPYSTLLSDIVRISYAGHIILVFPVMFFPLRLNLDALLFPSARHLDLDNLRFALVSMGLSIVVVWGAIFIPNIWIASEFTGATVGFSLAFVFPASIALKDPHGIATRKDVILSVLMIILAVFSSLVAIYSTVYSLLRGKAA